MTRKNSLWCFEEGGQARVKMARNHRSGWEAGGRRPTWSWWRFAGERVSNGTFTLAVDGSLEYGCGGGMDGWLSTLISPLEGDSKIHKSLFINLVKYPY